MRIVDYGLARFSDFSHLINPYSFFGIYTSETFVSGPRLKDLGSAMCHDIYYVLTQYTQLQEQSTCGF